MKDYYAILGVTPDATQDEIRDQYRFLMHTWHPDKYTNPKHKAKAAEKAAEINEAVAILSNENKRADYDFYVYRQNESPEPLWPTDRPTYVTRRLVLAPGISMEMVRVPPGEFLIGSGDGDLHADDNEKPQRWVLLQDFWIGRYDVTNAQFGAFVQTTHYKTTAEREGGIWGGMSEHAGATWLHPQSKDSSISGKDSHPVVQVSWEDAVCFCAWVSLTTGKRVALPTEAQWEKAARGLDGQLYPWGYQAPTSKRLNSFQSINDTTEVGEYSPAGDSPYGAADMAGNVRQWTSSLHKNYPYYPHDGRENQTIPASRILRGGSFLIGARYVAKEVRCAARFSAVQDDYSNDIGFRVVAYNP